MNTFHSALMRNNQNTPRYTSYPTAPHFHDGIDSKQYTGWLETVEQDEALSLYIHIPYCRQLCWYCGCNTKATGKYQPVQTYVGYLLREIALVAKALATAKSVRHIHFGGGSPSMLTPDDFTRIMAAIRTAFPILADAEIAIEIDPRELTEAKVAAYARTGVNRVSFGIQDFHADVQKAVNRRQPFYVVYDAIALVRSYGIEHINMDLLYGLPHQTDQKIRANIDFANALKPTRIALFGYAHVPWMKKHMQQIDVTALPDAAARLSQFDVACDRLRAHGYQAVGLDHFVLGQDPMLAALRSHALHRNFQGYTIDASETLIGLGVSSIGALNQGYVQNFSDIRSYMTAIDHDTLPVCKGVELSARDKLRRSIIEELMCYFEVDLEAHCAAHGANTNEFAAALEHLRPLANDGLVALDGFKISVPEGARQAVRLVAAAFDDYLAVREQKHAQIA